MLFYYFVQFLYIYISHLLRYIKVTKTLKDCSACIRNLPQTQVCQIPIKTVLSFFLLLFGQRFIVHCTLLTQFAPGLKQHTKCDARTIKTVYLSFSNQSSPNKGSIALCYIYNITALCCFCKTVMYLSVLSFHPSVFVLT